MIKIEQFHHITNEVSSVDITRDFYVKIFGFEEVKRPNLRCNGAWLDGLGLHLHLIEAYDMVGFEKRKAVRLYEFENNVPFVDHIAFLADDLERIGGTLEQLGVPFKKCKTTFGAAQIFLLDPDGRIIELAACAPKRNEIACTPIEINTDEIN